MININDPILGDKDEIYTYRPSNGKVMHFAITLLQKMIDAMPLPFPPIPTPITKEAANDFMEFKGVEQVRLDKLTTKLLNKPVLVADISGLLIPDFTKPLEILLIDGHHRYVKKYKLGHTSIEAYLIPKIIWEKFLIDIPVDGILLDKVLKHPRG